MNIQHDIPASRFFLRLDNHEASLNYSRQGQTFNLYHVFVPDAFRGQGIAVKLAIAACDYIHSQQGKIIPTCPFIANQFLPRHPQYHHLLQNPPV